MKVTYMNELPTLPACRRNKLQNMIENFYNRPERIMKITWEDGSNYKNSRIMRTTFAAAVKKSKRPIKVVLNDNDIYLIKELESEQT